MDLGAYPMLRFPWKEVKAVLGNLASVIDRDRSVQLAYINPETGAECLPTLGFSALELRPGQQIRLTKRYASSVFHVVEGSGDTVLDGVEMKFAHADTISVPAHVEVTLSNASSAKSAYLFIVVDAPLQRKLGIYQLLG